LASGLAEKKISDKDFSLFLFLSPCLNGVFENTVEIPRIKHGNKQTLDTLINEEACC